MKRKIHIAAVFFLCILMISVASPALAYSGSDYTSNSSLAAKLDNLIQGNVAIFSNTTAKFPVGSSLDVNKQYTWKNGYYSGYQCYAYAQAAYYYLFGDVPYHGGGGYSNSSVISGVKGLSTLSYDTLSRAGVGCGAYIRTTNNSSGAYSGSYGHSMIVLTYNSSSITILHGNANNNGLVSINSYSWSSFNSSHISGRSRYVSHIVQPNATANTIGVSVNLPSTLSLEMGKRTQIQSTGTASSLSWSSSNSDVAMISQEGYVFGNRPGTAIITATADDGAADTCIVTITEPVINENNIYYSSGWQLAGYNNSDDVRAVILQVIPSASGYYNFYSSLEDGQDSYGYIYDSTWNELARDDDSGEDRNFSIRLYLNAGYTYYLVNRMYNVHSDGTFTYNFSFVMEEQSVEVPESLSILLGTSYTLDFSMGSASSISWSSSDTSVLKVYDGRIYGVRPGTAVVTLTDDDDSSNTAQCTVTVMELCYLEGYVGLSSSGTYVEIPADGEKCALVYAFEVPYTADYGIFTSWGPDSYGILFDSEWNELDYDDDSFGEREFLIEETLEGGETYYILVRGYDVTADFETFLYVQPSSDESVELDGSKEIHIDIPSWNSYVTFLAPASGKYVFFSEGSYDTYGYVYDEDFNLIASNDDGGEGTNFSVTCDLTEGRTYYLRSRFYDSQMIGGYYINVETYRNVIGMVGYVSNDDLYWCNDLSVGESGQIVCELYDENNYDATNQNFWCDELDNDVCTVSREGYVQAKSNGIVYVTAHAEENPEITTVIPIYIHDEIGYSLAAEVDEDGIITLTFTGIPNDTDKLCWFELISLNGPSTFYCMVDAFLPGYTGYYTTEESNGDTLQSYDIFTGLDNSVPAGQTVVYQLMPSNKSELWNTTQEYDFIFNAFFCANDSIYSVSSAMMDVTVSLTFPEEKTPLNAADFILPANTAIIESEAFCGIPAKRIRLPEGVTEIGSRAFGNCPNLKAVYIPESCTYISRDAFPYAPLVFTIYGRSGSYAQQYAYNVGYTFVSVD